MVYPHIYNFLLRNSSLGCLYCIKLCRTNVKGTKGRGTSLIQRKQDKQEEAEMGLVLEGTEN
jgi:hypothetical protein